jgi:hypothetical protein
MREISSASVQKVCCSVMPDLRSLPPYLIRGRPNIVPTKVGNHSRRLAPGFHRESWIPAGVYPDENRGRNDTSLLKPYLRTDSI